MARGVWLVQAAAGVLLAAAVMLGSPGLAAGQETTLPAGGGEPGKVYVAHVKAVKAKDVPALKKLVSAQRVKEMDSPDFKEMLGMIAEMMPTDLQVLGGSQTGDTATLNVTGTAMGEKQTGTVSMVREGGAWKVDKESWKN